MPEYTADRESAELAGDALADWVLGLGLDPAIVRPYGAAEQVMAALVGAGWRRLPDAQTAALAELAGHNRRIASLMAQMGEALVRLSEEVERRHARQDAVLAPAGGEGTPDPAGEEPTEEDVEQGAIALFKDDYPGEPDSAWADQLTEEAKADYRRRALLVLAAAGQLRGPAQERWTLQWAYQCSPGCCGHPARSEEHARESARHGRGDVLFRPVGQWRRLPY